MDSRWSKDWDGLDPKKFPAEVSAENELQLIPTMSRFARACTTRSSAAAKPRRAHCSLVQAHLPGFCYTSSMDAWTHSARSALLVGFIACAPACAGNDDADNR